MTNLTTFTVVPVSDTHGVVRASDYDNDVDVYAGPLKRCHDVKAVFEYARTDPEPRPLYHAVEVVPAGDGGHEVHVTSTNSGHAFVFAHYKDRDHAEAVANVLRSLKVKP